MYALIQKTFYNRSFYRLQVPSLFHFSCLNMYITAEAQFLTLKMRHILIFIQRSEAIDGVQFQP